MVKKPTVNVKKRKRANERRAFALAAKLCASALRSFEARLAGLRRG